MARIAWIRAVVIPIPAATALVMITPAIVVTFALFVSAIPAMIVLEPAAVTIPVTAIELPALIPRSYPDGAAIGRPRPISSVPMIAAAYRIPVPLYPVVIRARSHGPHLNHPGTRRLTNPDSYGYLSVNRRRSHHKNQGKQNGKHKFPHIRFSLLKWNICRNNFSWWDDAEKGVVVEVLELHLAYVPAT